MTKCNLITAVPLIVTLNVIACSPHVEPPPWSDEVRLPRALEKGKNRLTECQETKCQRLDPLEDYSVLNDMPHVTELVLGPDYFDDLGKISGMSQLTDLELYATEVSDFSPLSAFTELNTLSIFSISHEVPTDLFVDLVRLRELKLETPDRSVDVAFVSELIDLQELTIRADSILDLAPLEMHPKLSKILIEGDLPVGLSALLALRRLSNFTYFEGAIEESQKGLLDQLERSGVMVREVQRSNIIL